MAAWLKMAAAYRCCERPSAKSWRLKKLAGGIEHQRNGISVRMAKQNKQSV